MMNNRTYRGISDRGLKKLMEELVPTKQDIPKEKISRMSYLEQKQIKDHPRDLGKIQLKRDVLRKKRKSKRR